MVPLSFQLLDKVDTLGKFERVSVRSDSPSAEMLTPTYEVTEG